MENEILDGGNQGHTIKSLRDGGDADQGPKTGSAPEMGPGVAPISPKLKNEKQIRNGTNNDKSEPDNNPRNVEKKNENDTKKAETHLTNRQRKKDEQVMRRNQIQRDTMDLVYGKNVCVENAKLTYTMTPKENHSFKDEDDFDIYEGIFGQCGKIHPSKIWNEKQNIVISAPDQDYVTKVKRIQKVASTEVATSETRLHHNLNTVCGIIDGGPRLTSKTIDRVKNKLIKTQEMAEESYRITDVVRLGSSSKYLIKFDNTALPEGIYYGIGYYNVTEYRQLPKRCLFCHRYGHSTKGCRLAMDGTGQPRCFNCGKEEHEHPRKETDQASLPIFLTGKECTMDSFCVPCRRPGHNAKDKKCPSFLKEKTIMDLQKSEKINPVILRKRQDVAFRRNGPSYAEVTETVQTQNKSGWKRVFRGRNVQIQKREEVENRNRYTAAGFSSECETTETEEIQDSSGRKQRNARTSGKSNSPKSQKENTAKAEMPKVNSTTHMMETEGVQYSQGPSKRREKRKLEDSPVKDDKDLNDKKKKAEDNGRIPETAEEPTGKFNQTHNTSDVPNWKKVGRERNEKSIGNNMDKQKEGRKIPVVVGLKEQMKKSVDGKTTKLPQISVASVSNLQKTSTGLSSRQSYPNQEKKDERGIKGGGTREAHDQEEQAEDDQRSTEEMQPKAGKSYADLDMSDGGVAVGAEGNLNKTPRTPPSNSTKITLPNYDETKRVEISPDKRKQGLKGLTLPKPIEPRETVTVKPFLTDQNRAAKNRLLGTKSKKEMKAYKREDFLRNKSK